MLFLTARKFNFIFAAAFRRFGQLSASWRSRIHIRSLADGGSGIGKKKFFKE
jgi:hypothetical protein